MLEQLTEQKTSADRHFRNDLMRMLFFMRVCQLMITAFQQNSTVKGDKLYKPMKRFSQEVSSKIDWFLKVLNKIAGEEHATVLDKELALDNEKILLISELADHIAHSEVDLSNVVDLVTNKHRRKELMLEIWKQSRFTVSPDIHLNEAAFETWYNENFPESTIS